MTDTLTKQKTLESIARERCIAAGHDPDGMAAKPAFTRKADTPSGMVVLQGSTLTWRPLWTFYV